MVKIWAILEDLYPEYISSSSYYPMVLSNSLDAIITYVKKNRIKNPIIVYKELEGAFKCSYDDEYDDEPMSDWNYWEGEKCLGHTWKNKKTGEFDPDYESRDDVPEEEWDNWEDGILYEVYKDGELVETYFD